MRFFRPQFDVVLHGDPAPWPGDKIGGLPVGVRLDDWPRCADCSGTMSLIGQFHHDPARLDLAGPGRVLTLWQCEHDPGLCETWSADSGANAALVVDRLHAPGRGPIEPPDPSTVVHPEVRVTTWVVDDDGVPVDLVDAFYDEERHAALGEPWWSAGGMDTRLGGVPMWIQSAGEGPGPPFTFVGQIADGQHLPGDLPAPRAGRFGIQRRVGDRFELEPPPGVTTADVERWIVADSSGWYVPGPNFGDGGMAYVFVDPTADPPTAKLLWQCG
jgi:hypothetical protein